MAKAFETWTVCKHKPIEKISDNLWRVSGLMPNGRIQRQMALARMADGRVIVHNAVALDEAEMRELEAWGTPSVLFVPNAFHRQDAAIWKQRYPHMTVVAPRPAHKRVNQVVKVEASIEDAPGDERASLRTLDGMPGEGVLEVRSGDDVSLVLNDAVLNVPRLRGVMGIFLGPTGRVSTPRATRWLLLKDRRAFVAELERLAATPGLRRVLVGHGKPIDDEPAAALRSAAALLG